MGKIGTFFDGRVGPVAFVSQRFFEPMNVFNRADFIAIKNIKRFIILRKKALPHSGHWRNLGGELSFNTLKHYHGFGRIQLQLQNILI